MADQNKPVTSISIGSILFLIFLTLKLAEIGQVTNWSWWWVTSPLWIPVVLVLVFVVIALIIKNLK